MEIIRSLGGLVIVVLFLGCVVMVCGVIGSSIPSPTPTPLPTLVPQSAEIILAQAVSQIAIDSTTADRNTAHPSPTPQPTPIPSEAERVVRAAAVPLFACIAVLGCVFVVAILALVWHSAQGRRDKLMIVQELHTSIKAIQTDLESLRLGSGRGTSE